MAVNEPSSTDNFVQIEDRVINKVADATDTTDNITLDDRVFIFKENESKQIEKVCNAKVSWLVDKFAEEATKAKNDAITAKNEAVSAQQASESARDRSKEWANKAENSVVADNEYSPLHYMKKAQQAKTEAEAIRDQMQQSLDNAVEEAISAISSSIKLSMFPVGSIYHTYVDVNPGTFIGGTWVRIAEGRMLIGVSSKYTAGATGGEETHKLTVSEMPSHNHGSAGGHTHSRGSMDITGYFTTQGNDSAKTTCDGKVFTVRTKGNVDGGTSGASDYATSMNFKASGAWTGETSNSGAHTHSSNGGDTAHNNMPPYLAVYIWHRTA